MGISVRDVQEERVIIDLGVKGHLAEVDLQSVLIDGTGDENASRKHVVAEVWLLVVGDLGDDVASRVVDILLIAAQGSAADVDDTHDCKPLVPLAPDNS